MIRKENLLNLHDIGFGKPDWRIRFNHRNISMTLHTGRTWALAFAALVLFFASCDNKESSRPLAETGKGKVVLSISQDYEMKSEPTPLSEFDDYNFRFVGVDGYATSQYYRYGSVSWPMEWYFGLFRLEAESCTEKDAEVGYGRLRHAGIGQPFSVVNGQLATASVVCSVANFRVGVNFNDKMFMSYKDFKLVVESVLAPVYEQDENGEMVLAKEEQLLRTLDFTTVNKVGFYNMHQGAVLLRYTLYVMVDGATEFIERKSGYFTETDPSIPAAVYAGDAITLNVEYVGDVQASTGIKFIVNGERTQVDDYLEIGDYIEGSVTEDR